jgi:hypothetical protein
MSSCCTPAVLCRRGVTSMIAVPPGDKRVGYVVGTCGSRSKGDIGPRLITGASSRIVAVPVDANVSESAVVGWLTQNVPSERASGS